MFSEAQNFAIVQTELDDVFKQVFDDETPSAGIATALTAEIFKPVQTDRAAYITETNKALGFFSNVSETQTVPVSTPHVANKQTTLVNNWVAAMPLSKDMFDDNMHGVWAEDVKQFALMARKTQDYSAFGVFRNSFTTTLTADGVALISASHTLVGGGTTSNILTSPAPLSRTTINTAIVTLRTQVNQAGVIIGNEPAYLLVPPELYETAVQITESALVPDSGNNAMNVFSTKFQIRVYTSPYLSAASGGSATAWWLLSKYHSVSRLIRQGLETALTPWQYSNNRTYNYQGNYRESYFVTDYAGIVGATGT